MKITEKSNFNNNGGFNFYFKNYHKNVTNSLKPGEYLSKVESIEIHPGYDDGSAFLVKYKLKAVDDAKGTFQYDHKETFLFDYANKRTRKFVDYLEENGIAPDKVLDFEGCVEKITIEEVTVGSRLYMNIVNREFVSSAKAGDEQ